MTVFLIILGIVSAVLIRLPYITVPYMIAHGGDAATIGLMVNDLCLGKFFPFFYGQAFNGVLEIYIVAPLVKLFGMSRIVFFIGAMIIYTGFLVSTYLLSCEFKGRRAGLFALFYCVVPPFYFYYHSIWLQGYHVTILVLGNIILLMSLKIAKGNNRFILYYALLGLAAGLGLWNHYTILFYVAPALIFIAMRVRLFNLLKGGLLSFFMFILGSMPFWIYNLRYGFRSLNLYDGHPCVWVPLNVSVFAVLRKYVSYYLFGFFGIHLDDLLGFPLLCGYIACIINLFAKDNRKLGILFILFLLTLFLIPVLNKQFIWLVNDYRYVLAFMSLMPVAAAALSDRLSNRFQNKRLGLVFICFFISINGWQIIKNFSEHKKGFVDNYKRYEDLISFLNLNHINGFLSNFIISQDINYITGKTIVGAEFYHGRAFTDLDVDSKDSIALIDSGWLKQDAARLCYKYGEIKVGGMDVLYNFIPYPYSGEALNRAGWTAKGNSLIDPVSYAVDGNLDTYWVAPRNNEKQSCFEVDFGGIYNIYKFEVVNVFPYVNYCPYGYKVEVSEDGSKWMVVRIFNGRPEPIFWSGPRLYWDCLSGRWEEIFSPVKARFLKITQLENGPSDWLINEIYVYEYLGKENNDLKKYLKDAGNLFLFLRDNNIKFVYADYWISGKIREWARDGIGTVNRYNECWPGRENTSRLVRADGSTAIVVNAEDEAGVDDVLKTLNLNLKKKTIGRYICYYFDEFTGWEEYFFSQQKCLYWTGTGFARINSNIADMLVIEYKKCHEDTKIMQKRP